MRERPASRGESTRFAPSHDGDSSARRAPFSRTSGGRERIVIGSIFRRKWTRDASATDSTAGSRTAITTAGTESTENGPGIRNGGTSLLTPSSDSGACETSHRRRLTPCSDSRPLEPPSGAFPDRQCSLSCPGPSRSPLCLCGGGGAVARPLSPPLAPSPASETQRAPALAGARRCALKESNLQPSD